MLWASEWPTVPVSDSQDSEAAAESDSGSVVSVRGFNWSCKAPTPLWPRLVLGTEVVDVDAEDGMKGFGRDVVDVFTDPPQVLVLLLVEDL